MKSPKLQIPHKNKHQAKTEATLRELLDAAEKIFVRDGYERTQIETIAAEVGRTKGAVYAHFKGKEDLFLALFERNIRSRMEMAHLSTQTISFEEKILSGRKVFVDMLEEQNWALLILEFKLFALRNTKSVERIRDLYQLLHADADRVLLTKNRGSRVDQRRDLITFAVLRGIPSAIALERHFDPALQSPDAIRQALEITFDALAPRSANTSAEPKTRKPSNSAGKSKPSAVPKIAKKTKP